MGRPDYCYRQSNRSILDYFSTSFPNLQVFCEGSRFVGLRVV